MDWGKIGEIIVANGIVGAGIAWGGILIWRWQQRHKRRFEVAEQVRIVFEKACRRLQDARYPVTIIGVGKGLAGVPEHSAEEYVRAENVINEIRSMRSLFDDLAEAKVLCSIHLGDNATQAITVLESTRIRVGYYANRLLELYKMDPEPLESEQLRVKYESFVFSNADSANKFTPDDDLSKKLREAGKTLKYICDKYHSKAW